MSVCLTYVLYIHACEHVLLHALIGSFSLEICSCAHIGDVCAHVENIYTVTHILVTVMHANLISYQTQSNTMKSKQSILSAATSGAVAALT